MIGPSTLDGGYSPSQVMSSAMERTDLGRDWVEVVAVIGDAAMERVGFGAKAEETARMTARMRMESFAILIDFWLKVREKGGRKRVSKFKSNDEEKFRGFSFKVWQMKQL